MPCVAAATVRPSGMPQTSHASRNALVGAGDRRLPRRDAQHGQAAWPAGAAGATRRGPTAARCRRRDCRSGERVRPRGSLGRHYTGSVKVLSSVPDMPSRLAQRVRRVEPARRGARAGRRPAAPPSPSTATSAASCSMLVVTSPNSTDCITRPRPKASAAPTSVPATVIFSACAVVSAHHLPPAGAERHAHADLLRALAGEIGHQAVDAHQREHEARSARPRRASWR